MVEFRVLGPVEAYGPGGAVPLGGPRQRRIMALLLAHADRWVSVAQLVDGVWPAAPPATARIQVRNGASALRRALAAAGLGGADLTLGLGGYLLRTEGSDLDVRRFQAQVAAARAAATCGRLTVAAAGLRAADALWRGPALAGLADGALAAEAVRLEELRLAALEERVDVELALGWFRPLVPELTGLVDAEPGRERLVRALMVALVQAGRPADALRAFDRVQVRLRDELGLAPGWRLRELRETVLAGGRLPSLPSAAGRPRSPVADPRRTGGPNGSPVLADCPAVQQM